jgi:ankyrin repeat protein
MSDDLFAKWKADWQQMEAIARKRGWEVTPLSIAPPATEAQIKALEIKHGLKVPSQLREVLTRHSASVTFGWRVPQHQRPMELVEHLYPSSSGIRGFVWDLSLIDDYAFENFQDSKEGLENRDLSEAENRPEMWLNQFPFGYLINGDSLTIDVSQASGPQPVRYFSHELEGLHGHEIAPDFFSFIIAFSKLGCAGHEHSDWFAFIPTTDQKQLKAHISATGEGAQRWFAWRDGDNSTRGPDDPPLAILGTTAADKALLKAAYDNDLPGIAAALDAGAKPDCIWNSDWGDNLEGWGDAEFYTAVSHAVRNDSIGAVELLLKRGATLNTRLLPVSIATEWASLATLNRLIALGGRVNGWKNQRYWPLHLLVTRRAEMTAQSVEDFRKDNESWQTTLGWSEAQRKRSEPRPVDDATYTGMLDALLAAKADPDAPWDNGITMLMWGGPETSKLLLKHGASVHARDAHGWTVLHRARTPEKLRLLVANGADVNARAKLVEPTKTAYTPLQGALLSARTDGVGLANTFLELGADPKLPDSDGRNALAYCFNIDAFKLIQGRGLDPKSPLPGGGTLLHNLATLSWPPRVAFPAEVEFFNYLLGLGLDINAQDNAGQTLLHIAAARESYDESRENYELLIKNGADTSIQDKNGKRAVDLAAKSLTKVRAVLK